MSNAVKSAARIIASSLAACIMLTSCGGLFAPEEEPAHKIIVPQPDLYEVKNISAPEPTYEPDTATEPEPEPEPEPEQEQEQEPAYVKPEVDRKKIASTVKNRLHTWGEFTESQLTVLESIKDILGGYKKRISVIAYPLDGENGFSYNSGDGFFSACTIKAAYVFSLCRYLERENYDLSTMLMYKEKHYHEGSGTIRYTAFGSRYTVAYLITQALSISDNVAYIMLLDYFGRDFHNEYMDELGCESLKTGGMWAPKATTEDFVVLWNELYDYFREGTEYSELYRSACTNSDYTYLAEGMTQWDYSHKSGHNYGSNPSYNDVILVWKERPYILAVFTASEGDESDRKVVEAVANLVNYALFK